METQCLIKDFALELFDLQQTSTAQVFFSFSIKHKQIMNGEVLFH